MNTFLEVNKKRINDIYYTIEQYQMQASAVLEGLNLNHIKWLFNGLVREIEKLQNEIDELKKNENKEPIKTKETPTSEPQQTNG